MRGNSSQARAIHAPRKPVLVLAGPGTGKTYVITERIKFLLGQRGAVDESTHGIAHPSATAGAACDRLLALTFTNKASREMKYRIASKVPEGALRGSRISTFHGLCSFLLRTYGRQSFDIASEIQRTRALQAALEKAYDPHQLYSGLRATVRARIERWKGSGYSPEQVLASGIGKAGSEKRYAANAYKQYQYQLQNDQLYDFGDLTLYCVRLLEASPDLCRQLYRRWRHVLVDEFQDTSALYWRLVLLLSRYPRDDPAGGDSSDTKADSLASAATSGSLASPPRPTTASSTEESPAPSIMVVGDPNQCIYTWRLASSRNTHRFLRAFPSAMLVHLHVSYRSTLRVLRASNAVVRQGIREGLNSEQAVVEVASSTAADQASSGAGSGLEGAPSSLEQLRDLRYYCLQPVEPDRQGPLVAVMLFSTAEDEFQAVASLAYRMYGSVGDIGAVADSELTDRLLRPPIRGFSSSKELIASKQMLSSSSSAASPPKSIAILGRFHSLLTPIETVLRQGGNPYTRVGMAKALDRPDTNAAIALLRLAARSGTRYAAMESLRAALAFPPTGVGAASIRLLVEGASQGAAGGEPESSGRCDLVVKSCHLVAQGKLEIRGLGSAKVGVLRQLMAAVEKVSQAFDDEIVSRGLTVGDASQEGIRLARILVSSTGIARAAGVEDYWLDVEGTPSAGDSNGQSSAGAGYSDSAVSGPARSLTPSSNSSKTKTGTTSGGSRSDEGVGAAEDDEESPAADPATVGAFSCLLSVVYVALADWSADKRGVLQDEGGSAISSAPVVQPFIEYLLERLALIGGADLAVSDGAESELPSITLSTIHASKGLEYDTVIVPGLVEGVLPAARRGNPDSDSDTGTDSSGSDAEGRMPALGDSATQEERRLLYVAMTRARTMLVMTCHEKTMRRGRQIRCPRSRFLDSLESLSAAGAVRSSNDRSVDVVFKDCRRAAIRPASESRGSNGASASSSGVQQAVEVYTYQLRALVQSSRRSGQRLGQGDFRGSLEDLPTPASAMQVEPKVKARPTRLVATLQSGLGSAATGGPRAAFSVKGAGGLPGLSGAGALPAVGIAGAGMLPGLGKPPAGPRATPSSCASMRATGQAQLGYNSVAGGVEGTGAAGVGKKRARSGSTSSNGSNGSVGRRGFRPPRPIG